MRITPEITPSLVWRIADGNASESEFLDVYKHALLVLRNQLKRRENLDVADPCIRLEDLEQETALRLASWCKSFPRDGQMGVDQWIRVCWRNASINLSEYYSRRRPRSWVSLDAIRDAARNEGRCHGDDPTPVNQNIPEIWADLCRIVDRTPMPPKIRRRMKKFLGLRLNGYSVREAVEAVRYFTDPQGEIFRKNELVVITEYLGHKPLSR